MTRPKTIVFISGNGSNLQNIIEKIEVDFIKMDIIAVISDNPEAKGLIKAQAAGIKTLVINTSDEYINRLFVLIDSHPIDLIILSGFMKILPKSFTDKYRGKIKRKRFFQFALYSPMKYF